MVRNCVCRHPMSRHARRVGPPGSAAGGWRYLSRCQAAECRCISISFGLQRAHGWEAEVPEGATFPSGDPQLQRQWDELDERATTGEFR